MRTGALGGGWPGGAWRCWSGKGVLMETGVGGVHPPGVGLGLVQTVGGGSGCGCRCGMRKSHWVAVGGGWRRTRCHGVG